MLIISPCNGVDPEMKKFGSKLFTQYAFAKFESHWSSDSEEDEKCGKFTHRQTTGDKKSSIELSA